MNTPLFFLATEKPGGLFDLDGTLPLVALQFLVLMFFLNFILYTPLLSVINERNQYINKNLANASSTLAQSKKLIEQYEAELAKARKEGQLQISALQKLQKDVLEADNKLIKNTLDEFLKKFNTSLNQNKERVLVSLKDEIDSLSSQILSKILA